MGKGGGVGMRADSTFISFKTTVDITYYFRSLTTIVRSGTLLLISFLCSTLEVILWEFQKGFSSLTIDCEKHVEYSMQ